MALCSIIELGLSASPLWGQAPAWLSITRAAWSYSGWVLWSGHLPQVLRVRPTGHDRRCSPTIRKIKPNTSVILIQKKRHIMGVFYVLFLVVWRKTSRLNPSVSVTGEASTHSLSLRAGSKLAQSLGETNGTAFRMCRPLDATLTLQNLPYRYPCTLWCMHKHTCSIVVITCLCIHEHVCIHDACVEAKGRHWVSSSVASSCIFVYLSA